MHCTQLKFANYMLAVTTRWQSSYSKIWKPSDSEYSQWTPATSRLITNSCLSVCSQHSCKPLHSVSIGVARSVGPNALPTDESGSRYPASVQALQGEVVHSRREQALQECWIHEGLWPAREVAHTPKSPAQVWGGAPEHLQQVHHQYTSTVGS